jgi:hypothetical protein
MPTTTNFSWTTPADTDLVKDGAAAIRTLAGNIDTSLVDLKGGTTGQVLAKNSNTDLDFIWSTSSGGMTLISETVASSNTALTLGSIPQTYKQLMLVWHGIRHSATGTSFYIRLNNDSGSNYKIQGYMAKGATVANTASSFDNFLGQAGGSNLAAFGANVTISNLEHDGKGILLIDNYASTTKLKTGTCRYTYYDNTASFDAAVDYNYTYNSTSAISSIDVIRDGAATFSNTTNTSIRLYGIA